MEIYKINDVVDSEFIRFPLTLLANKKYRDMSLEAKVVYSLLLNRLTLSQRNGWLNEQNEVYLIYTREETADTLNITYKKAIAAFKELIQFGLVIEKRRGRGFPNIIFLVKTELPEDDAKEFKDGFDNPNGGEDSDITDTKSKDFKMCQSGTSRPAETAYQDMPNGQFEISGDGSSRPVKPAYQDMPKPAVQDMPETHTSKIDNKKIDYSQIYESQSVSQSPADGRTDDEQILEDIYDRCELYVWEDAAASMFQNAIDRLYYSETYRIGNAILPRAKIRSYLNLLDSEVITGTYDMMRRNTAKVKNTTGYIMSTLINSIFEKESDSVVCMSPEYLLQGGGSG